MNPEPVKDEELPETGWDRQDISEVGDNVGGIINGGRFFPVHDGVGNGKEGSKVGETDGTSVGGNASPK